MAKKIYIVIGGKGGVGKTIVSKSLTEHLLEQGENVLAIDADCANPGLHKTFEKQDGHETEYPAKLVVHTFNLAQVEGWSALITLCSDLPDHTVVIDTPAGSHESIRQFATILHSCLGELDRDWCSLFVVSGQRDSVELLAEYLEITPRTHVVHAILNGFFGDGRSFERFQRSNTRVQVLARRGTIASFPALAAHIVNAIDWDRLSFTQAARQFAIGHRAVLIPWLSEVRATLQHVRSAA
jgi:NAD(P)-dependent dehydrogenase (short-subunit alcohol dehydrogenase family)